MKLPQILLTVLALAAARTPAPAQDQLVPAGAVWNYLDDGSDQGSAWRMPGFDDSSWSSGPAQLGYGDGDEATVVSFGGNPSAKYITTWFRREFSVSIPGLYVGLTLELVRDDGVVVFLNGSEVLRENMPGGAVGHTTPASSAIGGSNEDVFHRFYVPSTLLVPGQNVLAVELHQSSATSSDVSFDLRLWGETSVAVVRGPYLQQANESGVSLRWSTNVPADSRVMHGDAPNNLTSTIDDAALVLDHEVRVDGLTPETTRYYSVGTTSQLLVSSDASHRFTTAPPVGAWRPVRIWAVGDSGTADANAAAVRDAYSAWAGGAHADVWLMLGDNAYNSGLEPEYQAAVFETYPQTLRNSVLWPARGNHETDVNVYYDLFTLPTAGEAGGMPSGTEAYYSYDWANVHFLCLDSQGSDRSVGGAMYTWAQSDLAATEQDWIIAYWHHPPYSKGSHDSDTESQLVQMRQNFLPLLERWGVDLVLCGHSHSYERSYLLDGHYGTSAQLQPGMILDSGDGDEIGDGAYVKTSGPHGGAVYAVAGSSGKTSGGALNHPAMLVGMNVLGSLVVDVDGAVMDVRFLRSDGAIPDSFTIRNDAVEGVKKVCFGDGTGAVCPCINFGGDGRGCTNSVGFGARLHASGSALVGADDLVLNATDCPADKTGMFLQGATALAVPFKDGILCAGDPTERLEFASTDATGAVASTVSIVTEGDVLVGHRRWYQYWFRDAMGPCGSGSNLTHGLRVHWH